MRKCLFLIFFNLLFTISAMEAEKSSQSAAVVREAFSDLGQDLQNEKVNEKALEFLQEQLKDPKSPIWRELSKMMGLSDYDRLPEGSKHLSLLSAKAFIESGGLDILYLWGGQDFAKEDLITVRDYLRNYLINLPIAEQKTIVNALNLPHGWDRFDLAAPGAKADPNLDSPFLVEDSKFQEPINKWVKRINPVTNLQEWSFEKKPRAITNAIGLLARLLLHTDSEGRSGTVARSIHVSKRMMNGEDIANLLILIENSRKAGDLSGFNVLDLFNSMVIKNKEKITKVGDTLSTGLKFDVDQAGLITEISIRDFSKPQREFTTIKLNTKEYSHLLTTQFFHLLFDSLGECGYFGEVKNPYPYFLPSLLLEGFVILSDREQAYNVVLNKYLNSNAKEAKKPVKQNNVEDQTLLAEKKALVTLLAKINLTKSEEFKNGTKKDKKPLSEREIEILCKSLNSNAENLIDEELIVPINVRLKAIEELLNPKASENKPDINLKLQYSLFGKKNFFDLKEEIVKLANSDPKYFDNAYVLHYLSTKGITTQSQITTDYKTKNGIQTPSFTNCVETGLFNFFGVYLPFNQSTGEINLNVVKNKEVHEYLELSGKKPKLKDFTERFLVDQFWLPYIHIKCGDHSDMFKDVHYVKLAKEDYDIVKAELASLGGLTITDESNNVGFECFKASGNPINHPIGLDIVFVKENPEVVLYELGSGLMTFVLFERMIYQSKSVEDFLNILTSKNKTKDIPKGFESIMKDDYKLDFKISSNFGDKKQLWRGACDAKAQKFNPDEPLTVNFHINDGHTDVKIDVSDSGVPMPKESYSLPGFLQMAMYSSSMPVEYDNFDCQHWLWLVQNVLFDEDTIIKKEWQNDLNSYHYTKFSQFVSNNTLYKFELDAYKQHISLNPDWDFPVTVDYSRILKNAIDYNCGEVYRKIISSVAKGLYGDLAAMSYAASQANSLEVVLEEFSNDEQLITLLKNSCEGKIPMTVAARNPELLSLVINKFRGNHAVLRELLSFKDLKNQDKGYTPMHAIAKCEESLKVLLTEFKDDLPNLSILLCVKDRNDETPLHYLSTDFSSLSLVFETFQFNPTQIAGFLQLHDRLDNTPMLYAMGGNVENVKLILDTFKNDHATLVKLLLLCKQEKDKNKNPLNELVRYKNSFQLLIGEFENDRDCLKDILTARLDNDYTPMHQATTENLRVIIDIFKNDLSELRKLLTVKGWNDGAPIHSFLESYGEVNQQNLSLIIDAFKNNLDLLFELFRVQDREGNTPMHILAKDKTSLNTVKKAFLFDLQLFKQLLTLKTVDTEETPMHILARDNNASFIIKNFRFDKNLLFELFRVHDRDGKTPLDLLKPEQREEIENIINGKGKIEEIER